MYSERLCLSCSVNNVNVNVNINHFVNVNVIDKDKDNVNVNDNDKVNNNGSDGFVYLRSSYNNLWSEQHPPKENPKENKESPRSCYTNQRSGNFVDPRSGFTNLRSIYSNKENNISINVNGSLQSWLDDEDNIVNTAFPEKFRCIISGQSECGQTFLLKELTISNIYFDKL